MNLKLSAALMGNRNRSVPLLQRFWARVEKRGTDECWPWIGRRSVRSGGAAPEYGLIHKDGRDVRAHRVSWEIHAGHSVPDGMHVLHRCDNPCCVNPGHLFVGTHRDNMRDMGRKGRGKGNRLPRKFSDATVEAIRERRAAGVSVEKIAATIGCSPSYVSAVASGHVRPKWVC